jgi:hypothetical protein
MQIKLSFRDIKADTTDIWHSKSETEDNNPVEDNVEIPGKPQVDIHLKMDKERAEADLNMAMPLNVRNQLERSY